MYAFYTHLDQFLVTAGLENSTVGGGCSEIEIVRQEQRYGIQFPLAYRLFLQWWGRTILASLDQDFRLEFLDYSWDSARELLAENHVTLEPDGFVFGEWQGYSFLYFLLGSDNPPVRLCIIQSDAEPGLAYSDYGYFTDWLINRIKRVVQTRHSIQEIKVDVPAVWAELDRIAQMTN